MEHMSCLKGGSYAPDPFNVEQKKMPTYRDVLFLTDHASQELKLATYIHRGWYSTEGFHQLALSQPFHYFQGEIPG